MALKPSRTLTATKLGLYSTLALGILPLVAMLICQPCLDGIVQVTSTLAIAIATIATGGTMSVGARHWGSKEGSSFRKGQQPAISEPIDG